jgi:hypothetical protein
VHAIDYERADKTVGVSADVCNIAVASVCGYNLVEGKYDVDNTVEVRRRVDDKKEVRDTPFVEIEHQCERVSAFANASVLYLPWNLGSESTVPRLRAAERWLSLRPALRDLRVRGARPLVSMWYSVNVHGLCNGLRNGGESGNGTWSNELVLRDIVCEGRMRRDRCSIPVVPSCLPDRVSAVLCLLL